MNLNQDVEKISLKKSKTKAEVLICDGGWFEEKNSKAVRQSVLDKTGIELETFHSVERLSLYPNGFLIAHELKTLSLHFRLLQAQARTRHLKLGYFLDSSRDECIVLKERL